MKSLKEEYKMSFKEFLKEETTNDFDKLSFVDKKKLIKSKFNKVSDEMLDDYARSKWVNLPNDIKRVVV